MSSYDNIIILGDFNCEMKESMLDEFSSLFNLKNLVKSSTCFKSKINPTCIDLILTNKTNNFKHTCTIETGLSDFHLLTVTVLKSKFKKAPPKVIKYRDFSRYNSSNFHDYVTYSLNNVNLDDISFDDFNALLMKLLDKVAPLKTKYIRGNEQPFMNKELKKHQIKRARLLNIYRKTKTDENYESYKKQRNFCVNLLKKTKFHYYGNLNPSEVCDNKRFWQIVKPLFSDKKLPTLSSTINLIEDDKIISNDEQLAQIFSTFFSNAVRNLNISFEYDHDIFSDGSDLVFDAIQKYDQFLQIENTFYFKPIDYESVTKENDNLDH